MSPALALLLLAACALPASAEGLDMEDVAGLWKGRQHCTSGDSWVRVRIRRKDEGYIMQYTETEIPSKGSRGKHSKGTVRFMPATLKGTYAFRAGLPPRNIFRLKSVRGAVFFEKEKKDRVTGKVDLGELSAAAGITGRADVTRDRQRIAYMIKSWALMKKDDCLGSIKRIDKKKGKEKGEKAGRKPAAESPAKPAVMKKVSD